MASAGGGRNRIKDAQVPERQEGLELGHERAARFWRAYWACAGFTLFSAVVSAAFL